jgi:acetyltransferase-like isoleucine patch superfamily enzyme
MRLKQIPGRLWLLGAGIFRRGLRIAMRPLFAECGSNVTFWPIDRFSYGTIRIGNDVYIGSGACFSAKKGLTIGNKVMFGPNVTIRGGNHNSSIRGRFMFDVHEKRPEDDLPVAVQDDAWIGAGAIILKGVTIGRGAIVAAGAVVTRDVEPYSIVGGIPARLMRYRWSPEEIRKHELVVYPQEKRLTQFDLLRESSEENGCQ